ncbi:hypothetical protein FGO68_gene11644 [Halteria grandinella]|uniref:Uncharacterized protein n=1 Tax=Halteria grandinella TaxID=5974 RepID=A0A8J8SUS0_HALGN|nr:hypothetical protein FGO68_gene11644 [Halteria grandinella]
MRSLEIGSWPWSALGIIESSSLRVWESRYYLFKTSCRESLQQLIYFHKLLVLVKRSRSFFAIVNPLNNWVMLQPFSCSWGCRHLVREL